MLSNAMKYLLIILSALFLTGISYGTIAQGKTGKNNTTGSTGLTVSWTGGGSSTAGNTIRIYAFGDRVESFTINQTFTSSGTLTTTAIGGQGAWWVISNASSLTGIVITPSTYSSFAGIILEASGLTNTSVVDKKIAEYDNGYKGGTSWTCNATGTLSQSSELVDVICFDDYVSVPAYVCSGYTATELVTGCEVFYQIVSNTNSLTPSGTLTAPAGDYRVSGFVMTYKGGSTVTATIYPVKIDGNCKIDGNATLK